TSGAYLRMPCGRGRPRRIVRWPPGISEGSVVAQRVDAVGRALPRIADPDLEVDVRSGRPAAGPDPADLLAARHDLAHGDRHRGHVVHARVQAVAIVEPDLVPAAVALPAGVDDPRGERRDDRRPVLAGDVDPRMARPEILADVVATTDDRPMPCAAGVGEGPVTATATAGCDPRDLGSRDRRAL